MLESVAVAAGRLHTCALVDDGTVRCWGANSSGQLGNGTTDGYSNVPVTVTALTDATAITAGDSHACALLGDGTARCWGANSSGQLGNGTAGGSSGGPVTVSGLTGAVAISAGLGFTCALLGDGSARCWGDNSAGQLGNGTTDDDSGAPVTVSGLTGAVALNAGGFHTCAVLGDGTTRCWGSNFFGQLGNGTTGGNSNVPVTVTGLTGATAITGGGYHTCALLGDGTATCWGRSNSGQLGDGTTTNSSVPVTVSGLTGATALSAGGFHTCALLGDAIARCWGENSAGQLGNGTTTRSNVPVTVIVTG